MVGLDNPLHLIFLLVIVLLLFGAKRLPEMGRSLGTGMRSFKESLTGETADEHRGEVSTASVHPAAPDADKVVGESSAEHVHERLAA